MVQMFDYSLEATESFKDAYYIFFSEKGDACHFFSEPREGNSDGLDDYSVGWYAWDEYEAMWLSLGRMEDVLRQYQRITMNLKKLKGGRE